jgi:DNA repair exonuclease SbcCD nuclease subunit
MYLSGNHEKDALSSMENLPKNLKVFGDEWTRYDIDEVTFIGRNNLGYNLYNGMPLEKDRYNIAVLHGEVGERSSEGEIGRKEMAGLPLDYIALGHYHTFNLNVVDNRVSYAYSGTLEGRGFDECGEKGYVLIDTRKNTKTFIPFAKRTVYDIEVDLSGIERQYDCQRAVENALISVKDRDIVRITVVGTYSTEFKYNAEAFMSAFAHRYFYFEIKDRSRLEINLDELKYDKSLKGELIRTVMAREDIEQDKKAKIISCAIAALNDEDYGG